MTHRYSQPGTYNPVVTVRDKDGGSSTDTLVVTITKRDVAVSYTGDVAARITDTVNLGATVVDEYGAPVVGRVVTFKFDGAPIATALTGALGIAQTTWSVPLGTAVGGGHTVQASMAMDSLYNAGASIPSGFVVSKENTVLTYTGITFSKPSKAFILTALLTDDEGNPVGGKTVNFVLGGQPCGPVVTNASGVATCTIAKLMQKPGFYTLTTSFAGDANYNASTDTDTFRINS